MVHRIMVYSNSNGSVENAEIINNKEAKLFSEAVSLTGFGKFNIFLILATGGCLMCVIIESMSMSFIIPAAQCDLTLSMIEKSFLASITFFGIILTSHFWGFLADVKGRRNILIFCLIISSLTTFSGGLMVQWTWLFILLRFFNGALIGGASSIIYAYVGEFHNDEYRPRIITYISTFVAIAQMYIPALAWVILPAKWSFPIEIFGIIFRPWRLLLISYGIPSLIVAVMLSFFPESPKFLLAQHEHKRCLEILTKMFVINTGRKSEEYPVSTVILDEDIIQGENFVKKSSIIKLVWTQTRQLFQKNYLLKTLMLCYLQFGVFLSYTALALWFPQILNNLSKYAEKVPKSQVKLCKSIEDNNLKSSNTIEEFYKIFLIQKDTTIIQAEICDDSVQDLSFLTFFLVGCAIGVTYLFIGTFINKIGKKYLLAGGAFITAACGLGAQFIAGFETIVVLCGIFLLICSMIGVINALAVDLYPTNIRALAIAFSLMFGRLGATIGSNIAGTLIFSYCQYVFVFFAINHALLILSTIFLPMGKV